MPIEKSERSKTVLWILIGSIIVAGLVIGWVLHRKTVEPPAPSKTPKGVPIENKPETVIDYHRLKKDEKLQTLMNERKAKYGVGEGVHIIARADESIKVGDQTVTMQEIQEKIRLKTGDIVETDLQSDGTSGPRPTPEEFGVYVVQPGDNLWNIHFRFLKDYFDRKGIAISPLSDEPRKQGYSSGVGKLLKFSENIVYIYNIREHRLDTDLNMIHPRNKLMVYKMTRVYALLDGIDYKNVARIQFDGDTLWLPSD